MATTVVKAEIAVLIVGWVGSKLTIPTTDNLAMDFYFGLILIVLIGWLTSAKIMKENEYE